MLRATYAISFVFCCSAAYAQQGTGTISGIVTDSQNAIVGGAPPSKSPRLRRDRRLRRRRTNEGSTRRTGLAVGSYEVMAELKGFKRAVRSGLTLQVNQNAQVNLVLEVGQITESVQVVGETPLVDTSGATLGQVVENRRIQELPLNGRSALALTMLTPVSSRTQDRQIRASEIAASNSRPSASTAGRVR